MKAKHFLLILISFCIIATGCGVNNDKLDIIIEKAYSYIQSPEEKNTILNWKDSSVAEIDYNKEPNHKIWDINTNKEVDLKGKQIYKVVFKVKDSSILGDINVYVEKKANKVLGVDLRE